MPIDGNVSLSLSTLAAALLEIVVTFPLTWITTPTAHYCHFKKTIPLQAALRVSNIFQAFRAINSYNSFTPVLLTCMVL